MTSSVSSHSSPSSPFSSHSSLGLFLNFRPRLHSSLHLRSCLFSRSYRIIDFFTTDFRLNILFAHILLIVFCWSIFNRRRHNWDTVSQHLYGFFHRKWLGAIRDISIAMPSTVKLRHLQILLYITIRPSLDWYKF